MFLFTVTKPGLRQAGALALCAVCLCGTVAAAVHFSGDAVAAAAPVTAYESAAPAGLRVGQNVSHAKFGQGVIVATEGRGADARVQVNFGAAGMKWLALEFAKLTPL